MELDDQSLVQAITRIRVTCMHVCIYVLSIVTSEREHPYEPIYYDEHISKFRSGE